MPFDFDLVRPREQTWSSKWTKYRGQDILPYWVADMDFDTSPSVLSALHARLDAGVLGYTAVPDSLIEATQAWLQSRYGWGIDPEWLVFIPAVVGGFNLAVRAAGVRGDHVLVPVPVYHPFLDAPRHAEQEALFVQLTRSGDRWQMDLERFGRELTPQCKSMLFCNPQNPTGRVYNRAELEALAEFCLHHELVLCSDEIHCPLVLDQDCHHIPVASLSRDICDRTITLMAPTKAFNIPGVGCGFAIISNADLRARFRAAKLGLVPSIGPLAYVAAEAALRDRSSWLDELLVYLRGNHQLLQSHMQQLRGISTTPVQGTYLGWIDTRELGIEQPGQWFERFGVGLSDGVQFGGPGFVRFNFGCPRSVLQRGLDRFAEGVRHAAAAH